MPKNNEKTRKLTVKRETLRMLGRDDLEKVQGGYTYMPKNCTGRLSGCIGFEK